MQKKKEHVTERTQKVRYESEQRPRATAENSITLAINPSDQFEHVGTSADRYLGAGEQRGKGIDQRVVLPVIQSAQARHHPVGVHSRDTGLTRTSAAIVCGARWLRVQQVV